MSFRNKPRGWGPAHFPWLTVLVTAALVVGLAVERPWRRATFAAERAGTRGEASARRALLVEVPDDSPVDAVAEGPARTPGGVR